MAPSNGGSRGSRTVSSSTARPSVIPVIPLPLVKPRTMAQPHPSHPDPARADFSDSPRPSPPQVPLVLPPKGSAAGPDTVNDQFKDPEAIAEPPRASSTKPPIDQPSTDTAHNQNIELVAQTASPAGTAAASEPPVPPTPSSTSASKDTSKESATPPSTTSVRQQPATAPRSHPLSFPPDVETAPNMAPEPVADATARMSQLSISGPPHVHHPHPSNGSLVFGGLPDSNTASPAPLSGGIYPPPVMPGPNDQVPLARVDVYGRPLLTSPTLDGFPPTAAYRGTSTPHSFHGSQASFHAEENGHSQFPMGNGHGGYVPRPIPPAPFSAAIDPRLGGVLPVVGAADGLDTKMHEEAVVNLQRVFTDPEFADCFFEVRLPNSPSEEGGERGEGRDGQPPLRIPSHRFVLAQSPTLKRRLHTHGTTTDGTLLVYGDDKYLRADALYYSVRTLYGTPLGAVLPTYLQVRSIKDQFDLALGFAAAGRFLQLDLVLYKGVRSASRLVAWETVEKAFEYALPGYICPYSPSPAESSPTHPRSPDIWATAVRELLNSAVTFVIHNFPKDFLLDTESGTPTFGRLPSVFQGATSRNAPTIARGTSMPTQGGHSRHTSTSSIIVPQMPLPPTSRPSRNPRLMNIKFGDISPPTANGTGESVSPRLRPSSTDSLFSRILLHLPFNLLKEILEDSSLGSVSGGVTLQARHKTMIDVVQEREARRIRAVESLRRQTGPLHHFYKSRVSSVEAQPVDGDSDYKANNMSLKEEVVQANRDGPFLAQSWHRYEFAGGT